MSSTKKLREAKEDELESLILKAEAYLPHSITVHGLLTIGFRRNIFNRTYSKIFIPEDESLPFFIIITGVSIKNRNNMTPFWDPKEISKDIAKELLLSVPDWNWKEPCIMYAVSTATLLQIEEIMMEENGISNNKLVLNKNYGYCYTIDKDYLTPNFFKTDFLFASLKVNDAKLVHENWIYFFAEDTESISRNLKFLPSVAAYVKEYTSVSKINESTINNGGTGECENRKNFTYKPISWALTRPFGEIGFNFTFPEYRNKGLSGAVTKELVKILLQEDINPIINVCGCNPAAVKSVENIGFRKYCEIGYQIWVKKGMQLSDF